MPFTHLHTHSHYSLLDGLPQIPDLIAKACEYKMHALALTDHGAMYGIIEFYKKCKEAGIKPIIGMEAYVSPYPLSSAQAFSERKRYHLTLLAANNQGYKNLMKLASIGWLQGFYYKPRIDMNALSQYGGGLIILSGCMQSELSILLSENKKDAARELIAQFQTITGKENFFLEIQTHSGNVHYEKIRASLIELYRELNIPLAATSDVHYIDLKDKEAQDVLLCVQTGKKLEDKNRMSMTDYDLHFTSQQEMDASFSDIKEAIETTNHIADLANVEIELGKWVFPSVEIPNNKTAEEHLRALTFDGMRKRLETENIPDDYKTRANYELDIITKKGYAPYFLVIADIIGHARENGIITTTRGSAAGSLVSYCIGITTADPISFDLPFERFLNPFRPSPPDIDIDIEDARRNEIIHFVQEKYGEKRVANIITFGTLLARAAVRDTGRVLNLPYSFCDKLAKMIPHGIQGFKMTLDRALAENSELQTLYNENEEVKTVIDYARRIEGCARHGSVHAAGVVIAPTDLTEFSPLQKDVKHGTVITQYDMHAIEDTGLLKMDLLGITNLSILGLAREIIQRTRGISLDLNNLALDDKKTYQLLGEGKTFGVFQLAGSGMTRYLKELEPSSIFDIMAMISLYRPGPMESIPEYIRRKKNPSLVSYPHPKLEPILKKSYGIITYQDDVLLTAIGLAGYNWEEADKLRKAIGKKIPAEMAAQKQKFTEGCVLKNGMTLNEAEKIWLLIEPFAAYGFNKAHGSSYALVAYQTAYLKANYSVEFMAALLTCESSNMEKIAEGIAECENLGIKVLPPDINESLGGFTVIDTNNKDKLGAGKIRFGLNAIKHLGAGAVDGIIRERKSNGAFASLADFIQRVPEVNKKILESLIRSGAMDRFGERKTLDYNVESMLNFARSARKEQDPSKLSLFGAQAVQRELKLAENLSPADFPLLAYEKEYLGLYLTAHPLDGIKPYKEKLGISLIKQIKEVQFSEPKATIIGIVAGITEIRTKQGEQMLFVKIEDFDSSIEAIVFPRVYEKTRAIIQNGAILLITGEISKKDEIPKLIVQTVHKVDTEKLKKQTIMAKNAVKQTPIAKPEQYIIELPTKISKEKLKELKAIISLYPGNNPLYLRIDGERVSLVKTNFKVAAGDELDVKVKEVLDLL